MALKSASSSLAEIEFLARSAHRVTALDALAERPHSRTDLLELTEASPSTIRRTLCEFEDRRWVRRDGHQYETTELGAFVALGMRELIDRVETARRLRDIWHWLPIETGEFTVEMVSDATVTTAVADAPYKPVNRFVSLLEETDKFRFVGFDIALLEPCKDELRRRIVEGMETEIIDPPSVARYILSTYPEHCSAALESGNFTVRLHDDLPPYGVSLFDDRIGISGFNPDSGAVRVLIDTDAPEAREWAESTYDSYRRGARSLTLETAVE